MGSSPPPIDINCDDEKVVAAAQHIVKSLASSKNAADDMIRILSGFDHRLSHLSSAKSAAVDSPSDSKLDEAEMQSGAVISPSGGQSVVNSSLDLKLDEAELEYGAAANLPSCGEFSGNSPSHTEVGDEQSRLQYDAVISPPLAKSSVESPPLDSKLDEAVAEQEYGSVISPPRSESAVHSPTHPVTSPLDSELDDAEQLILQYGAEADPPLIFDSTREEISHYLAAVDVAVWRGADVAVQAAMSRLESELRHLIAAHSVPLDASGLACPLRRLSLESSSDLSVVDSTVSEGDLDTSFELDPSTPFSIGSSRRSVAEDNAYQVFDLVHVEAISDLKSIADRMIAAGYNAELAHAYCDIRRDHLDVCLTELGVERVSIDEVQRIEWRVLDDKIKKWIQGLKTVVKSLLLSERRLCDQVLAEGDDEFRDDCFVEAAKGCLMQVLNFADAVSVCPRSSEKLFRILDMYEAVGEVVLELKELFFGGSGCKVVEETEAILSRLGDAVRGTLMDFGKQVKGEGSRRPMLAGEIHPVVRYVMNYLRLLAVYSDTLDKLLLDDGVGEEGGFVGEDEEHLESMTPFGRRLSLLISYLEANMEEKSKLYEDGALQCIFWMNNILYLVNKVKDSELRRSLGDNWVRRRRGKIRQYSTSYLRISWTKALSYLKDDGFGGGSGSGGSSSRMALKDRFKNFNLAFEEIYRTQSAWKVSDSQLREELRISISENVIPAYRAFLGRFGHQVDGSSRSGRYVKYTPEDLESHLSDFFEGSLGSGNHSRRRS